ncbi:HNH endonuclease [Lysinibacillus sp. BW-2-10]|uniref:HNH endonuclease n=1 Tax=Lysinibacillus sp. BW-2-10 TaxID=2590030 RepID=UPI00117EB7C2|nr:HNH endonuclease domain-containing protein [Lysinibacillus sp. BW-2-10]TSI05107.1 HNH endonuclease [Lysinibacillus sp. BW-2-10]
MEKKQYWKLTSGEMKDNYLTDADIWKSIHYFFYHSKNSTTYKFGFFKALLENLSETNEDMEISFEDLFKSFTKIYWNLVVHHQLWQANTQTKKSKVQAVIEDFQTKYSIPTEWNFDKIALPQQSQLIKHVKTNGKRNVIGATYGDFNEEIYTFDLKNESIKLNSAYYEFLQKYKRILTDVNNYQLSLFLEKFNEAEKLNKLLSKVEFVTQRQSLKEFELLLKNAGFDTCFYCKKSVKKGSQVDHFIPWSYIQNDHLWNFVLACPSCNAKKSNKLASENYMNQLIERNKMLVHETSYHGYFTHYSEDKLRSYYHYSQENGFRRV